MTESRLHTRLEPTFTDYSINKYKPNYNGKKKVYVKIYDSGIKGLLLNCIKKTGRKYFIQQFWFNGKSDYWTVGEFRPHIFEVKDCKTKVVKLMDDHTNDNNLWIKNPKTTMRHRNERIKKAEILNRQMKTINECIEELCKANFPKIRKEGTITANSMRTLALHLIGYNKRTQHLVYDDNEFGNGFITFKACRKYNTNKPESWDDLFSKFPSGHGCIKEINGKEIKDRSLYDSDLGKMLIEELTPAIVRNYLEGSTKGWATKRAMIDAFQILWANSKKYMGDDKPLNPTTREALEVKKFDVSKGKNSDYNRRKFTPETLQRIWVSLQKISHMGKHTFQSEALMLMLVSGVRQTEGLKITKAMVFRQGNKDNEFDMDNIILLPGRMTKNREDRFITITEPVAFILDRLDEIYKQPKFQKYKFIKWLFPTNKSTPKTWRGSDGELSTDIMNSRKTRLTDLRECWETMKDDARVGGVPRMLRKSYASIAVKQLKTSAKAKNLTGHVRASTLDIHYDVHNQDQVKEYANEVSEVLQFHKK